MIVKELFSVSDKDKVFDYLWTNNMDQNRLVREYQREHQDKDSVNCWKEVREREYQNFLTGWDAIQNTKEERNPDDICVVLRFKDDMTEGYCYDACVVSRKEFLEEQKKKEEEKKSLYWFMKNFMAVKRSLVLGYDLSPVSWHLYNRNEVTAAVYWELTWMGFDNETAEKGRQDFLNRLESPGEYTEKEEEKIEEDSDMEIEDDFWDVSVSVEKESEEQKKIEEWNQRELERYENLFLLSLKEKD